MKADEFDILIKKRIEMCLDVLLSKAGEYASDTDRLHNFKVAAEIQGISQQEAVAGMMAKHTTSVYDMVMSGEEFSQAQWDEKIGDHINYLLLLYAVLAEGNHWYAYVEERLPY